MPATAQIERSIHLSVLVVVERDGNRYHGFAPALKGLHVDGKTVKETFEHASEAIISYLNSLERTGDPLPVSPYLKVIPRYRSTRQHYRPILRTLRVQWPSQKMSGTR
jgi:predicted RNase H-like HicB family nuclease